MTLCCIWFHLTFVGKYDMSSICTLFDYSLHKNIYLSLRYIKSSMKQRWYTLVISSWNLNTVNCNSQKFNSDFNGFRLMAPVNSTREMYSCQGEDSFRNTYLCSDLFSDQFIYLILQWFWILANQASFIYDILEYCNS